jgi:hypothetical protein
MRLQTCAGRSSGAQRGCVTGCCRGSAAVTQGGREGLQQRGGHLAEAWSMARQCAARKDGLQVCPLALHGGHGGERLLQSCEAPYPAVDAVAEQEVQRAGLKRRRECLVVADLRDRLPPLLHHRHLQCSCVEFEIARAVVAGRLLQSRVGRPRLASLRCRATCARASALPEPRPRHECPACSRRSAWDALCRSRRTRLAHAAPWP